MRNAGLKYVCKQVHLRVENSKTPFTNTCRPGEVLQIPVGHMEGNYYCDPQTLKALQQQNRIVFRYSSAQGEITAASNPNGSLDNIAGICSPGRNVLGMMPHPDRSSESLLGSADGAKIFRSMAAATCTSAASLQTA
jgi:phosphoribosylformylglycinamidine synthase